MTQEEKPRCPQCGVFLSHEVIPWSSTGVAIKVDYVCTNKRCMLNKRKA